MATTSRFFSTRAVNAIEHALCTAMMPEERDIFHDKYFHAMNKEFSPDDVVCNWVMFTLAGENWGAARHLKDKKHFPVVHKTAELYLNNEQRFEPWMETLQLMAKFMQTPGIHEADYMILMAASMAINARFDPCANHDMEMYHFAMALRGAISNSLSVFPAGAEQEAIKINTAVAAKLIELIHTFTNARAR